ncbi:MAG: PIN domain-containing protein [Planctomycetes bacterium]|nr:PIN domain-containing protein [Planctomycetota bacterium]
MILLDTSAIYALASREDPRHREALRILERVRREGLDLILHTFVLAEAFALLHRRRGLPVALRMAADIRGIEIVAVDRPLADRAVEWLGANRRTRVSLVDAVSFIVMRDRRIRRVFAFDPDFENEGFEALSPG